MENFIVSARKYRPDTFDSVVGQDTVTATLKNAIATNHLSQAYLFCGPRGVGKTTCARILAKTLNCSNLSENIEACNECESCKAFNESRSFNIHELDAASNNSVDDIRNLIDQVRVPPQIGHYSIYIIDEVHMLSASAFNSFLKTLEEPPKHAIFILATTEKHKILPTILSRCQIFDFNRIRIDDIVKRLSFVAEKEKITAAPDALHIIAQKADGAMRDALSIFDQMVSFSGSEITYEAVIENLNVLDFEYYFKLTTTFLEGNHTQAFLILDEILRKGFDPHHLVTGLGSHFRDLLVARDPASIELLETSESLKKRYLSQSKECPDSFLIKGLDILSETDVQFRAAANQRLLTELSLLKLCGLQDMPQAEKKNTDKPEIKVHKKDLNTTVSSGKEEETVRSESKEPLPEEPVPQIQKPEKVEDQPYTQPVKDPESSYKPRTTSIKDALKGNVTPQNKQKEVEMQDDASVGKTDQEPSFTLEELTQKWLEFANSIKKSKPRLSNALKSQLPEISDEGEIRVAMENANQQDDFNRYMKTDILDYLRKELNYNSLALVTFLKEIPESESKPYTQEEKYQFLSRKNPNLNLLKNKMGLDLE